MKHMAKPTPPSQQQPSPATGQPVPGQADTPQQACPLGQRARMLQQPAPGQQPRPMLPASCTMPCSSVCPLVPWYENMTLSVKPEVHNVSQCHQRTESRPRATCTKNLVTFSCTVFELCEWTQTDRQTDRHTHHNTSQPYQGKVTKTEQTDATIDTLYKYIVHCTQTNDHLVASYAVTTASTIVSPIYLRLSAFTYKQQTAAATSSVQPRTAMPMKCHQATLNP